MAQTTHPTPAPEPANRQDDPWRTVQQVAATAQVNPETVRRAVREGRLKATRVNGAKLIRIRQSWADDWLD